MRDLLKSIINDKVTESRGWAMYRQNKVNLLAVDKTSFGYKVVASVEGVTDTYKTTLKIYTKTRNSTPLIDFSCGCPCDFFCKHSVATFHQFAASTPEFASTTAKEVKEKEIKKLPYMEILESFSASEIASFIPLNINLEPIITITKENKVTLEILIGNEKQYKLKSFYDFTQNVHNNVNFKYGKNLEFNHNIKNFANTNLVKYILKTIDSKSNSSDLKSIKTGALVLTSEEFYDFLKLNLEQKLNFKHADMEIDGAFTLIQRQETQLINATKEKNTVKLQLELTNKAIFFPCFISIEDEYIYFAKIKNYTINNFIGAINNKTLNIPYKQYVNFKNSITNEISPYFEIIEDFEIEEQMEQPTTANIDLVNGTAIVSLVDFEKIYPITTKTIINSLFAKYEKVDPQTFAISNLDDIFEFIQVILPILFKNVDEVNISKNFRKINLLTDYRINVKASVANNYLNLKFLTTEFDPAELAEMIAAKNKHESYYHLNDGNFISLENQELDELINLANSLNLNPEDLVEEEVKLDLYNAMYIDNKFTSLKMSLTTEASFNEIVEKISSTKIIHHDVPENINAELRNYQLEGFNWLKQLHSYGLNGILADDMGLGKTLQVITLLASSKSSKPSIVVCPSSLTINWAKEIEKFCPNLKHLLVTDNKEKREELLKTTSDFDVIITTYDILKRDIDIIENINFNYIILDEAQYIKNQTTLVSKAVKLLKSDFKIALSGTPIENSLSELWSIFDFLMPNYLHTYHNFNKNFQKPIVKENNMAKMQELKNLVAPFILRRLKSEVLTELPDKIENVIYVDLHEEQRKMYDANVLAIKESFFNQTPEFLNKNKLEILKQLMELRQICCSPQLVDKEYPMESAKYDAVIELLNELKLANRKALLFSQFTTNFELIKPILEEQGIKYFELTGKTSKHKRHQLVEKFNNDETTVFLISLKAGGTGLNIVGADTVIHLDPWWNVAAENQATDRAYRLGQTKNVNVYKIIANNTIEEKIIEMQNAKKELSSSILENNEISMAKLDKDELIDLFS